MSTLQDHLIPRKVYQVMVYDKLYDVYSIPGKDHSGQERDGKSDYWVYYSDPMPEGTVPPVDSEHWQPYDGGSTWFPRHCWDIRIKQRTTTKNKWDELHFSNHTNVEMYCNGKLFFSFGTSGGDRGLHFAWNKALYMMTHLSEHPFNFYEPEKENGRKIWWYGLPATVKVWREGEPWSIGIVPDYEALAKTLSPALTAENVKAQWWAELERRESKIGDGPDPQSNSYEIDQMYRKEAKEDGMRDDFINWGDAFSDGHIDWFRKDIEQKP